MNNPAETALVQYITENPDVSYTAIARMLKKSVSSISRLAQKHGLHRRTRTPLTIEDVERLTGVKL